MSDPSTLSEIIHEYETGGYVGGFDVLDEALVRCHRCGADNAPTGMTVHSRRRTEGASDPADMSTVYALVCPACGERGTLVLRYGPESSAAHAEVARALPEGGADDGEYTTPAERSVTTSMQQADVANGEGDPTAG